MTPKTITGVMMVLDKKLTTTTETIKIFKFKKLQKNPKVPETKSYRS